MFASRLTTLKHQNIEWFALKCAVWDGWQHCADKVVAELRFDCHGSSWPPSNEAPRTITTLFSLGYRHEHWKCRTAITETRWHFHTTLQSALSQFKAQFRFTACKEDFLGDINVTKGRKKDKAALRGQFGTDAHPCNLSVNVILGNEWEWKRKQMELQCDEAEMRKSWDDCVFAQ